MRRKFFFGTLLVTLPAIAFVSLFLIVTEFRSVRAARLANAKTFAGMIAANAAAAVLFDDPQVAQQILSGITAEPSAEVAALYDAQGKLYAKFPTNLPSAAVPGQGRPAGVNYTPTRLEIFADAVHEGRRAGSAYVRMNLSDMRQRLLIYVSTVIMISLAAVLLVLFLSKLLERWIVMPLLELSKTAQAVTTSGDYSLRAHKRGADEVGAMVEAFNQMLDETQRSQNERQRAAEALRESEERFRSMADNIAALAWMANPDGWIFFYNRRWFDYTGTTLEEMQGWGWEKVHHPGELERMLPRWKHSLATGEAWEDTFPLRGRDGQYRWFLSRAFPLRNTQGEITRWFGTNTDVTELRDTQEALEDAQMKLRQHAAELEKTVAERTARLRETVGELEAFSYSIAHDMRAPLRSMVGFSGILNSEHKLQLDPAGQDYLRRISTSAERLDSLIQDVLNYSKVVRGDLKLESVDVAKLIREIIESYPNLQAPSAKIVIEEPLGRVVANPAALTQVISNLLGNAVKFVAKGVEPLVVVRAEEQGDHVRLWFEDNGIGIEPEAKKRLFRIFQRVHRPELYEGTGIGLAIVRKAVERMDGRVGVLSELNKGSRFWVELRKAT
ncbi:MAG TPA: ATP-binding protein [Methylomirabilota bacterium]|nr:ATP-binding protein [Methylomirabilota bacterium]